jgi:hypothetical protein
MTRKEYTFTLYPQIKDDVAYYWQLRANEAKRDGKTAQYIMFNSRARYMRTLTQGVNVWD